jgi:hypothetical protein
MEMKSNENETALKGTALSGATGKEVSSNRRKVGISEETGNCIECLMLFRELCNKLHESLEVMWGCDPDSAFQELYDKSKDFQDYLKRIFVDSVIDNIENGNGEEI